MWQTISSQLHLIYINTPYNFRETAELEKRLDELCKYCKNTCIKHTYNALNEERGLRYFMKKNKVDLFSIATAGKSGFAQFFSPSLTEHLITHLEIPVLSIHK